MEISYSRLKMQKFKSEDMHITNDKRKLIFQLRTKISFRIKYHLRRMHSYIICEGCFIEQWKTKHTLECTEVIGRNDHIFIYIQRTVQGGRGLTSLHFREIEGQLLPASSGLAGWDITGNEEALKIFSQSISAWLTDWITDMFVEQPLPLPGSAKKAPAIMLLQILDKGTFIIQFYTAIHC